MFFVYQSTFFALCRRCRSLDYELEIFCDFIQSNGKTQRFAIGGGIQKKSQKFANIPIYEIELLTGCDRDRIEINIYFSESDVPKKANLKTTRAFLLQSDAFNRAPTPSEASSSRRSSKVQSVQNAKSNDDSRCVICDDEQRQVAFIPCGHWCTCSECSTGVINLGMNCPICRCSISGTLPIQKTADINTEQKRLEAASLEKPNECFCVFCEGDQQREIAFIPCGHFFACRKCSEEKLGSECSVCRCLVKDTLQIYP
uniref:RING-type domain-containing protein n=1 Tax=Globodera rostochiensis TaxID=31243 RepID=A0A914HUL6_GLORO